MHGPPCLQGCTSLYFTCLLGSLPFEVSLCSAPRNVIFFVGGPFMRRVGVWYEVAAEQPRESRLNLEMPGATKGRGTAGRWTVGDGTVRGTITRRSVHRMSPRLHCPQRRKDGGQSKRVHMRASWSILVASGSSAFPCGLLCDQSQAHLLVQRGASLQVWMVSLCFNPPSPVSPSSPPIQVDASPTDHKLNRNASHV